MAKKEKLVTRTYEKHTITADAFSGTGADRKAVKVDPLIVEENGMNTTKAVALLTKRNKDLQYLIVSIVTVKETVGMTDAEFRKLAKPVNDKGVLVTSAE